MEIKKEKEPSSIKKMGTVAAGRWCFRFNFDTQSAFRDNSDKETFSVGDNYNDNTFLIQ